MSWKGLLGREGVPAALWLAGPPGRDAWGSAGLLGTVGVSRPGPLHPWPLLSPLASAGKAGSPMQGRANSGPWTRDRTPREDLGLRTWSYFRADRSESSLQLPAPQTSCRHLRGCPYQRLQQQLWLPSLPGGGSPGVSVPGARMPELPPSFLSPVTPFGPLGLWQS